jgi:hypothetical protein
MAWLLLVGPVSMVINGIKLEGIPDATSLGGRSSRAAHAVLAEPDAVVTGTAIEGFSFGAGLEVAPSASHLRSVARSYTTRRIPEDWIGGLAAERAPRPGDLVLARVEKLGQHKTIHLPNGRRQTLFEGDEIIVAYANRYAPDQFEAVVPETLDACHLVASGGVAAKALCWHQKMSGPTRIRPRGLLSRRPGGEPINVRDAALPIDLRPSTGGAPVIAIAGTAMNAGKTTTAAYLARGLKRAGLRPGYAKVTGTGAGGDPWLLSDAGSAVTLDFTDVGHVSTYRVDFEEVERICLSLIRHLQEAEVDVILLEIADGLYQRETAHLMASEVSRQWFNGVFFASADAMGAAAGIDWLTRQGHRILGITGTITSSPLQRSEAEQMTGQRVIPTFQLADPTTAGELCRNLLPS